MLNPLMPISQQELVMIGYQNWQWLDRAQYTNGELLETPKAGIGVL
jgi:hypothetical protein